MLVDTSVWVDHLRGRSSALATELDAARVWIHPFVIGELACGNLGNRVDVLHLLAALPQTPVANHAEVLALIEGRRLMGRGLGWVDVHLLASASIAAVPLWTSDKRLHAVARELGLAFA